MKLANLRHEKFCRHMAQQLAQPNAHIHVAKAYSQVYGCVGHSAESGGSRLMNNVEVQRRIADIVHLHNPVEELSLDLKRLRRAKRTIYHQGKRIGEEIDAGTRLSAVEVCLKAQGAFKPEAELAVDARAVNFNIANLDLAKVQAVITEMKALRQQVEQRPVLGLPNMTPTDGSPA